MAEQKYNLPYTGQTVEELLSRPIPTQLSQLAEDSGHKTVSQSEKDTWNTKYSKPSGGIPSSDLSNAVKSSLDKADTALQDIPIASSETLGGIKVGTGLSIEADGTLNSEGLASVSWDDVTDKPEFADVATSGSYNDLTNKPSIPAAQVNSDWNSTSGISEILNKPTLATVATSGDYDDLLNKPTIPSPYTLPPATANSLGGVIVGTGLTVDANGEISVAGSGQSVAWSDVSGKPTTISGYGITDAKIVSGTITLGSDSITPLTQHQDISGKADKVSGGTENNFAALDSSGNLKDSGHKHGDYQTLIDSSHKLSADLIEDGTTNKVINVKPDWNAASGDAAEILNKPTTMTPSSHTHGNIQDGGTLQTNDITIANGDKLVVTDASDSNKVARTSVTFDGSTTNKYLNQKGEFKQVAYSDVSDTPSLGTAAAKDYTSSVTDGSSDLVTSGAVYTAIDNLPNPMVFKGSLGTGGTITSLPTDGTATIGDTYKVITAGTYASQAADIGDTFICDSKTSNANTWVLIPSGDEPSGTVTSVGIQNATNGGLTVSGSPITSSGTVTIGHSNVVTAGTASGSATKTLDFGDTFDIPSVTYDANGHITTTGTSTMTMPANPASGKADAATTLAGYGITDAKIENGTITLGSDTITPITSHQSVTDNDPTLAWGTQSKVATIGSTDIHVTLPSNPNTDTATAADDILDGSNSGTQITYAPYPSQQNKLSFDTSSTAPSGTDRLNLNGYLWATKLYSGGSEVLTSHQSLSNYVTLDGDQDITGVKTFVGQKRIAFKQSGSTDKLGFTLYNNSGTEKGYLEFNASNTVDSVPLMTLGNYASATAGLTHVGFRKYSSITGANGAYNLLAPLISDAKTPFSLTTTYTNFYLPLGFTDGTTTVKTAKTGVVDLSSILPSVSGKADKVSSATNGNFAGLDSNGNLTDSGKKASDFQTALSTQTAYTSKGSATKVPQITTNTLGQVTGITEVTITQPDVSNFISKSDTAGLVKNDGTIDTSTYLTSAPVTSVNNQTGDVVLNIPSAPGTLNTNVTTAQNVNSSEALSGTVKLHKVAKTGTYSDLIGTPTIPTVNNSTITLQANGSTVDTFTTNASSAKSINLGNYLTSTTAGLKIEVVSSMPSSPDANTIYIVQ